MWVVIVVRHLKFSKFADFLKLCFLLWFEVAILPRTTAQFVGVHCCVVVTDLKFDFNIFCQIFYFLPQICWNPCSRSLNRSKGFVWSQGGTAGRAASYQSYSLTWEVWRWTMKMNVADEHWRWTLGMNIGDEHWRWTFEINIGEEHSTDPKNSPVLTAFKRARKKQTVVMLSIKV